MGSIGKKVRLPAAVESMIRSLCVRALNADTAHDHGAGEKVPVTTTVP